MSEKADIRPNEAQKRAEARKTPAEITINEDWCKGCGICIEFCPKAVLEPHGIGEKASAVAPEQCIKCMLCVIRCPEFAIKVE